jgi:hypothetical protein
VLKGKEVNQIKGRNEENDKCRNVRERSKEKERQVRGRKSNDKKRGFVECHYCRVSAFGRVSFLFRGT